MMAAVRAQVVEVGGEREDGARAPPLTLQPSAL